MQELVFKELQERLLLRDGESNKEHFIERKNDVNQIITFLQDSNHVMIIGPLGIGKSTFLKIFQRYLHPNWNIFSYKFENKMSLYQEEFF